MTVVVRPIALTVVKNRNWRRLIYYPCAAEQGILNAIQRRFLGEQGKDPKAYAASAMRVNIMLGYFASTARS